MISSLGLMPNTPFHSLLKMSLIRVMHPPLCDGSGYAMPLLEGRP